MLTWAWISVYHQPWRLWILQLKQPPAQTQRRLSLSMSPVFICSNPSSTYAGFISLSRSVLDYKVGMMLLIINSSRLLNKQEKNSSILVIGSAPLSPLQASSMIPIKIYNSVFIWEIIWHLTLFLAWNRSQQLCCNVLSPPPPPITCQHGAHHQYQRKYQFLFVKCMNEWMKLPKRLTSISVFVWNHSFFLCREPLRSLNPPLLWNRGGRCVPERLSS